MRRSCDHPVWCRFRWWSLLAPLLTGCLGDSPNVTLRFAPPPGVGQQEITLVLLPVDIDHIIDSLGNRASVPRPSFEDIGRLLTDRSGSTPPDLSGLTEEWTVLRRNVTRLADSLNQVSRTSAGYGRAYARLRALYADLTIRERELENRLRSLLDTEEAALARRATESSDSLRQWEAEALTDLPEAIAENATRAGRAGVLVETRLDGETHHHLASGRWWAVLRVRHPENRFLEYYWNVSFTVNRWVPAVVPLGPHNMVTRWRH